MSPKLICVSFVRRVLRACASSTAICTLALAVSAALLLTTIPAVAGKPDKPPSKPGDGTDPCASVSGFPAFTYRRQNTSDKTWTIYVADSTGKCSRSVATSTTSLPIYHSFSYPVGGSGTTGRVIWKDEGPETIYAVDFTVQDATTASIDVGEKEVVLTNVDCCGFDLSRDGKRLYLPMTAGALHVIDLDSGIQTEVHSLEPPRYFANLSVNGDESRIFADIRNPDNGDEVQLVRIDLPSSTLKSLKSHVNGGWAIYSPAVHPSEDKVAYVSYIAGTFECRQLYVMDGEGKDLGGIGTDYPARYGKWPTWVGDNVLVERIKPMDKRGRCFTADSISQIEPDNTETILLSDGWHPDGR